MRCACRRACRPGDESQQPTCPHVRHSRRWTHGVPSSRHSSQPRGVRGTTGRIRSWWVQIAVARMARGIGRARHAPSAITPPPRVVVTGRGGSTSNAMHAIALAAQDLTGVLGRPTQHDLRAARQMQAMSFAFHIPLVCFGIAFPAMVLFVEGLWLRTGDATYRDLARRWSKALVVLFAVGVVTGTILSFELGLLWPNFMATFGSVFGLAFGIEGFAFFTEAIFIAMYVYSWDRVGPRVHLAMGVPIALAGIVGSLMVISVNGWMNHPTGFTVSGAGVSDVHPWAALFNSHLPYELVHMYLAGYMVAGFVVAAVYARAMLRGRGDRYVRAALVVPLTAAALSAPAQVVVGDWAGRMVARDQTVKLAAMDGVSRTQSDAPVHIGGVYENGAMHASIAVPGLLSVL